MKVIILAGGWGTRLGQLTDFVPKPMVRIGDRPILWHIMKIYSHYGFNDFVIALGVKGEVIKRYFSDFRMLHSDFTIDYSNQEIRYHDNHLESDWKVTLVDTGLHTLKGGRIKRLEPHLDTEINMLTYGDGVGNVNIRELVRFHKNHGKILTITGAHPASHFGELDEKDGRVVTFQEKPQSDKNYINGGFMVFNRELLSYLSADENCDFEYGPMEDLAKDGEVMLYKHEGEWACMDHERDVRHLDNLWRKQQAFWKIWDEEEEQAQNNGRLQIISATNP